LAYVSVEPDEPSRLCNLLHVIAPEERGAVVEPLVCEDGYGARITVGARSYDVYYNYLADGRCMHINSNTALGEFETDAYLLCICRDAGGVADKVLMAYGSYLRRDGEALYEDLCKAFEIIEVN
jgi:hypothetical protein